MKHEEITTKRGVCVDVDHFEGQVTLDLSYRDDLTSDYISAVFTPDEALEIARMLERRAVYAIHNP